MKALSVIQVNKKGNGASPSSPA